MSEHTNESRRAGTAAASGENTFQQASAVHHTGEPPCRPPNKVETMLRLFAAGRRLNRFEAERHGDHVLPSTVSELQARYGLPFARELETVPGRNGTPTQCARYWLTGEHLERAAEIAEAMRLKRGG